MDNQNLFNQLFHQLTIEKQRELLSTLKDMSRTDKKAKQGNNDFNHIDYRDLYFTLFFKVGRHIDGLITVLHKLEDIHLREPQTGQIIDLNQRHEDE